MPTAVADQFSSVFGNRRGAQRTEKEEADLQQSLRVVAGLPIFPFVENDEVAQRRMRLVHWLESSKRKPRSVRTITRKSKIYYGGELLIKRMLLLDWRLRREREATCRADISTLEEAGLCRAHYLTPEGFEDGEWVYQLKDTEEWPAAHREDYDVWLAAHPHSAPGLP